MGAGRRIVVSHGPPEWDAHYPDRAELRAEVHGLAECVCDQLLARIPAGEIRGLYLKGSSVKTWKSPLDYVPEISDVDIHVWFRDDNAWRQHLDTVPQALAIQAGIEACFNERIARPIHHPRLQLIVLNTIIDELEGFVHAPRSTVTVLHGEPYPEADYSDPDGIRRFDASDLVEKAAWVDQMPLHLIDKPGIYAREGLRQLVWRVAPAGPLALHVSGLDTAHVWSLNRTSVTAALRDLGLGDLADAYRDFYLAAWDYFLSGFTDTDACRAAILAATGVLTESAALGRQWLEANPGGTAPQQ